MGAVSLATFPGVPSQSGNVPYLLKEKLRYPKQGDGYTEKRIDERWELPRRRAIHAMLRELSKIEFHLSLAWWHGGFHEANLDDEGINLPLAILREFRLRANTHQCVTFDGGEKRT